MKTFLMLLIFITTAASCEQVVQDEEITTAHLEKQMEEIKMLIDSEDCAEDTGCKFMAYGSKACGGPQGYLIFSSAVDEEALEKMVQKYNKTEAAYNDQHGIMSDCSIPAPPGKLSCESGKCEEVR